MLMALPAALPASDAPPGSRPRIGLVLGGGGAKGAAHIGVLRVLDELRIPIDCVAGTSMGALVGATFAAGAPPAEIERSIRRIDWSRTVGTAGLRDRTPINRKLAGITYTNNIELGLRNGSLVSPGGLLKTQDIEDVLRDLVAGARLTPDFDDLPIPFRAVATDMLAGEMVILEQGDLAVAMRASMAVPGAFSPVKVDGRVLSDGGMMRNLPVDVARDLCADVVIAVSLASPPPQEESLDSALALAGRSLDVMIDANQRAQIRTLTERDVSIVVPMGDIGSADFGRVPEAIPLGYAAAREQLASLRRYSLPDDQYLAWRTGVSRAPTTTIRVAEVRVEGLQRVNPAFVRAQFQNLVPGAEATTQQIIADTGRVYALGDFERVEYRISGPEDARTLEVRPVEKRYGPDFVRFDLGLAANGGGELQALLRADHARTWINRLGAEWRSTFQLGTQTLVDTKFYQPLDVRQRFFVQPLARYERNLEEIFNDGDRIARYTLQEAYGQLDAGLNLGTRAQLRLGVRSGVLDARRDTGPQFLPEPGTEGDSSLQAGLNYDTRDAVLLPTRGMLINARYVNSGSWLDGDQDYETIEAIVVKALPLRGDSLTLALAGGDELSGTLPPTQQFRVGGVRTFPGLQRGELRGTSYWLGTAVYSRKLADIQSLFGQALYASVRLQAGRMGGRLDSLEADNGSLYGISTALAGRTPIGPLILSLGYVTGDSFEVQLAIGRPVPEGSILDQIR
jgi:NTE family protein